jgi:hypothetical protein
MNVCPFSTLDTMQKLPKITMSDNYWIIHVCLIDCGFSLSFMCIHNQHCDQHKNIFKYRLHVSSFCRCSKHISSRQYKLVCHPQQNWLVEHHKQKAHATKKLRNCSSTSEFFSDWLGLHEKRFNLDWRCNSNLLCLQRGYWGASGFGVIQQI